MLARRAYIPAEQRPRDSRRTWPLDVPCVAQLADEGMTFERPVTFLVGENGSGKSTLVEAFAEAWGLDAQGGRAGRKYVNDRPKSVLGEMVQFETTAAGARHRIGPRTKRKGYFLRAETAFGFMNAVSGMRGYWDEDTSEMSHGEGFLTVFAAMFREPGFYLMDEPEAALSFQSCLRLMHLMYELGKSGAQIICATHSPILASTPDADIIEVGEHGFHRSKWEDLALVDHWRRYMATPEAYLRHVTED
ncbi:AAA family ATPase [Lentzea aerocolonigenes]|uniref:AAA family ATPase n=1 Tax=Lentzea aerocolonigenes TaxID=68170 RepID=UPI0004C3BD3A|nr:AAA family ATPase [Lentzea aerocolonigenes]MCP2242269.1 putative ATPase [Lentzea aerocolonigenes]